MHLNKHLCNLLKKAPGSSNHKHNSIKLNKFLMFEQTCAANMMLSKFFNSMEYCCTFRFSSIHGDDPYNENIRESLKRFEFDGDILFI